MRGKAIDKILVNGNDVMSTGSGMMLNGLPADVVSGAGNSAQLE